MKNIGSMAWARKNHGILTSWEKLKLIEMVVKSELRLQLEKFTWTPKDYVSVQVPDSGLIANVHKEVESMYTAELLLHCMRTFHWGALLSQLDGEKVDMEQLYLASLLHDLGLTSNNIHKAACMCFAVHGANEARQVLCRYGADTRTQDVVSEAISAHLNPVVSRGMGFDEVAMYLQQGAFLDVTGKRLFKIPVKARAEVIKKYPRSLFKDEILRTMQMPHHESSRAGYMKSAFQKMVTSNPLEMGSSGQSSRRSGE